MTGYQHDSETRALCRDHAIVAIWRYVLDTSNDDDYPFVSSGQVLLRDDGAVYQRVSHSSGYGSWHAAGRAADAHTIAEVESAFRANRDYTIIRMEIPDDGEAEDGDDLSEEYHSDADGDRYLIVDPGGFDLTGWSVEVRPDAEWRDQNGLPPLCRADVREFSRTHAWYRSHKGSPWGHLRFTNDEVEYPWSVLVDHGETVVRWIPPET